MNENVLIRFDWVVKHMLRDKSNFIIVEGFLCALFKEDIKILEILESESNQGEEKQKFNRVDILVKDSKDRRVIIEIQTESEVDYLERLLFGTSKVVVENLKLGHPFREIKKVISISIMYFNLGLGDDYMYYGLTEFKGVHTGNPLIVHKRVKKIEKNDEIGYEFREKNNIFPEYYLIEVERFSDVVKEDIDEWVYFFKHDEIKKEFKSKYIKEAEKKLNILKMSREERKKYKTYLINLASEKDMIETAREEGIEEGREEGIEEGRREGELLEKQDVLIRLLSKKFGLEEKEQEYIKSIVDSDKLDSALDEILFAENKNQILNYLK